MTLHLKLHDLGGPTLSAHMDTYPHLNHAGDTNLFMLINYTCNFSAPWVKNPSNHTVVHNLSSPNAQAAGNMQLECVAVPSVTVVLPCTTNAKLLWQYAKILVTIETGSIGPSLNDAIKLAGPENSNVGPKIWPIFPVQAGL